MYMCGAILARNTTGARGRNNTVIEGDSNTGDSRDTLRGTHRVAFATAAGRCHCRAVHRQIDPGS